MYGRSAVAQDQINAKRKSLDGEVRAALDAAGRSDIPIKWDYDGEGIRLILEPPTSGLPRYRLKVGGRGAHGKWFHEGKTGFDMPGIIAMVVQEAERETALEAADKRRAANERKAAKINKALGLDEFSSFRAEERHGALGISVVCPATEEQIRVMVSAARACGLLDAAALEAEHGGDISDTEKPGKPMRSVHAPR